jgi:tetratricopeptide (TPR) repeat protein
MSPADTSPAEPRFSVVVLTRNEAKALSRLFYDLEAFSDRGGELLLMDTGSTDDTLGLAHRRGCRIEAMGDRFATVLDAATAAEINGRFAQADEGPLVQEGQRLFDFGAARQHAGSLAVNDFVLQLDASDSVRALDIEFFDESIAAGGVGAFEYDQVYGNVLLRIARFYDRTRYHWEGRVHESLQPTLPAPAGEARTIRCETTQLAVRHRKDERKPRHYLAGLALEVVQNPASARAWHYLGRELYYQRWYRSAIPVLEQHAAMADGWSAERSQSLCFVGECLEALRQAEAAKKHYRRAIKVDPKRREPLLRLATTHCRRGDFEAAVRYATEALAIPRTSAYPEMEANFTWIPHSILYWSLFWLGRTDEARTHWETCLELAPEESHARDHARLFPPVVAASRHATSG